MKQFSILASASFIFVATAAAQQSSDPVQQYLNRAELNCKAAQSFSTPTYKGTSMMDAADVKDLGEQGITKTLVDLKAALAATTGKEDVQRDIKAVRVAETTCVESMPLTASDTPQTWRIRAATLVQDLEKAVQTVKLDREVGS